MGAVRRAWCVSRCARTTVTGALVLLAASVAPAGAATYRAHDGASLQAAVASADASSAASTIQLTAGSYLPTSTLSISRDVTIVGPSSASPAKLAGSAVEPFPSDLLLVEAHARLTLSNVEVTAGGGEVSAAGIDDLGALDVESSTVAGNDGSGVVVHPGATATVRNSTLSDGLDVGVIDEGTASLINSTVAENANGGIDDSSGTLELTNTIVGENGSRDCTKVARISDHSLDSDGSCGVGALSRTNPDIEKLAANGGPTLTQALGAGSPAIAAGDDAKCPAEDQRHYVRPAGRCDIGAFQTGPVPGGGQGGPGGSGSGSGPPSGGAVAGLVGVSGHGTLRGARRSRITFTVRAEVGKKRAEFLYADGARHLKLRGFTLKSLALNARLGIATVRGSGMEMPSRRRVSVTLVLVRRAAERSLRIRLSGGYYESGRLLSGSIRFEQRAAGS